MHMLTSDFDYELPPEFIAQYPLEPRDSSRLLVLDRQSGQIEHAMFHDLGCYLGPDDLLVLNETRVIPARLFARKLPGGGKVEILLLHRHDELTWEALVGGKGLRTGRQLQLLGKAGEPLGFYADVAVELDGARRMVHFNEPVESYLVEAGHVPLPPYIHASLEDPERYQTVYARQAGSAAAPTAGLHFTTALIEQLIAQGVRFARATLHVGLDTFAPVTEDDPTQHQIHTEWCEVTPETASQIGEAQRAGGRVIAVGTTSVRTIETAAAGGRIQPVTGPTSLYILPGYHFRAVQGMITNFHLPRTTLIMLVSAFAGRENILAAYETAKKEGYRFYSFGDAMLIR
jgi:S-adenosylmethionine:tRNA ribosyltransferase-isomerase